MSPPPLPRIRIIATGGTIAGAAGAVTDTTGYRSGALGIEALLASVPALAEVARVDAEQPFSLDSKDLSPAHWLELARLVQRRLDDPGVDGVVLTHGTDTLEETAYFLHLVLSTTKPVVLTAAMRPASALSADGPMNLFQAVNVAARPEAGGCGVLAVAGDRIWGARTLVKRHTQAWDALGAVETGPLGWAHPPRLEAVPRDPAAGLVSVGRLAGVSALPHVEILHVAAGSSPALLDAAWTLGAQGVVLALPGNGSLPAAWEPPVAAALAAGRRVVRASRTGAGPVSAQSLPAGMETSSTLPPVKARVALMLSLAVGDPAVFARIAG